MLKLNNIYIKFDSEYILEDISLNFKPGEVTVITGSSGSGKSSIIKLLNGIIPNIVNAEVKGSILYNGEEITNMDIAERSKYISTVFQNPKTQFYCVNSTDEMAFALENKAVKKDEILERIDEYTDILDTKELLDKDIFKLSGGQKQMVSITSVACLNQDIYIFDEPSSSLDLESIEKLGNSIEKLKSMGKIIIIIAEHRLYYLKDLMDKLLIIQNKKIVDLEKNEINTRNMKKYNLRVIDKIEKEELVDEKFREKAIFSITEEKGLIECKDYNYSYGKNNFIFNMNLSFSGDINFIIGDNGIGKTTFIRSICGLNKGFRGKTYYRGELIKKPSEYISLVMQDVNYQIFTESVWDEISIVSDDDFKKENILKDFGLYTMRDSHPQSLSGGEKQRLAIALCKASNKPIVILDEPTSGLCKESMINTIKFIHEMVDEDKTIIIITHDYEFIKLCGGEIIEFVRD